MLDSIFRFFANANVEDLLRSGDVERNPGPVNNDFNSLKPAKMINGNKNVCFANSALQMFFSIPQFTESLMNGDTNIRLNVYLQRMFISMNELSNSNTYVKTHYNYGLMLAGTTMRFGDQHDASEFILHILNTTRGHFQCTMLDLISKVMAER